MKTPMKKMESWLEKCVQIKNSIPVSSETSNVVLSNSKNKNHSLPFEEPNQNEVHKNWIQTCGLGFSNENLYIRSVGTKGLGVFGKRDILAGEVVEMCHAILLEWKKKYCHDPSIKEYAYWVNCNCENCKRHGASGMILLGNGSVYNSASQKEEANVDSFLYPKLKMGMFIARSNIKAHEEILIWREQHYYDRWCKSKNENI